jgi:hypothetical protein
MMLRFVRAGQWREQEPKWRSWRTTSKNIEQSQMGEGGNMPAIDVRKAIVPARHSILTLLSILFSCLTMFLPQESYAQTSLLRYLEISPKYPSCFPGPNCPNPTTIIPAGSTIFNLPGYGSVRVTLSNINASGANTNAFYFSQRILAVQNKSAGYFNWISEDNIGAQNNSNFNLRVTYKVTFELIAPIAPAPDPKKLVLVISGLASTTTATVSQPVSLSGELQVPATGGLLTSPTVSNTTGTTTVVSSGASTGTDPKNTGWALFQTDGPVNLVGSVPTLSVTFDQEAGDGIGFTLGYADKVIDPCCPPWNGDSILSQVQLSQAGNLTSNISYSFLNSQPAGQPGFDQMQKYIDYLQSLNPSITSIVLDWRIFDYGPSGPGTSPNASNSFQVGTDVFTEWSCTGCDSINKTGIKGGNGMLTNTSAGPPYSLSPSGGLPVNRWYQIRTGIFLNDNIRFWDEKCDVALVTSTVYAADPVITAAVGNTVSMTTPGSMGLATTPGSAALAKAPGNIALATAPNTNTSQIAVHVINPGETAGQVMMLPFTRAGQ